MQLELQIVCEYHVISCILVEMPDGGFRVYLVKDLEPNEPRIHLRDLEFVALDLKQNYALRYHVEQNDIFTRESVLTALIRQGFSGATKCKCCN